MTKLLLGCYFTFLLIWPESTTTLGKAWVYFKEAKVQILIPDDWDQIEVNEGIKVNPQDESIWMFFKVLDVPNLQLAQNQFKEPIEYFIEDINCDLKVGQDTYEMNFQHLLLEGIGFLEGEEVHLIITLSQTPNQKVLLSMAVARLNDMQQHQDTLNSIFTNIQAF